MAQQELKHKFLSRLYDGKILQLLRTLEEADFDRQSIIRRFDKYFDGAELEALIQHLKGLTPKRFTLFYPKNRENVVALALFAVFLALLIHFCENAFNRLSDTNKERQRANLIGGRYMNIAAFFVFLIAIALLAFCKLIGRCFNRLR